MWLITVGVYPRVIAPGATTEECRRLSLPNRHSFCRQSGGSERLEVAVPTSQCLRAGKRAGRSGRGLMSPMAGRARKVNGEKHFPVDFSRSRGFRIERLACADLTGHPAVLSCIL